MKVLLGEGEGTSIFLWGFIEGEELYLTKFLIEHLKPGSIFIDVGAHFGYYTLLASELVGLSGEIHSFEPTPRTFQILKQNVEGKSNVWVNQRALFREKGFIELTDFGPQGGSYNTFLKPEAYPFKFVYKDNQKIMNPIKVETTTLDRYCFDLKIKPHFIKLDVEGAEYDVLLGSEKILACHPIISLEIWGREAWQESYESVFNFLERYSYKPYWLREGRLRPYPFEKDFFFTNLIFYPAAKSV